MSEQKKKIHLLPFLHVLAMLAIAVWWGVYFWKHTPSRELFRLHIPTNKQVAKANKHLDLTPRMASLETTQVGRFMFAAKAGVGDVACGLGVLVLFAFATGVYVRRFDTWLSARTSGQAVALRGQDLTAATLSANEKKEGVLK